MSKAPRQFVFQRVYDMAALVEACVDNEESFVELYWEDALFVRGLTRFSRLSVLHHYIYAMISAEHRHAYRKNSDLYEEEQIAALERLLDAYDIAYLPFASFSPSIPADEARSGADDPFYQWFLSQERSF